MLYDGGKVYVQGRQISRDREASSGITRESSSRQNPLRPPDNPISVENLENQTIAEMLARQAEETPPPAQRALRRASRRAFLWEIEAYELGREGRSLTELSGVGPYIEKLISRWIDKPPQNVQPDPLRAGFLTLCQARRLLAKKPAWLRNVKGDLQMHTNWSDGEGTIEEMAGAARARNYEYIAITDHTKGLKIAGGINEEQVEQQGKEIAVVSANSSVALLRSVEMNLNPQGRGDMDSSCLRKLDIVLGCFHSSLRKADDQTERYIAALRNPDIQILGHPRGRIYNFRSGLNGDWEKVFGVAAELDKAVEIDGYPDRQDLSVELLRIAKKAGCKISFGTDSHGPSQLRFMEFSAAAALSAGIKPESILNFMPKEELLGWVEEVRRQAKRQRSLARSS
jgi:histidinol phosphatase-like PHP family hydrolase